MKKEDILIRGHSCNYVKVSYFLQLADWKPNQRSIHHTGYPDTVSKEGYTTHGAFIVTYILFSFDVMIIHQGTDRLNGIFTKTSKKNKTYVAMNAPCQST